jgi:PAS domain S-box-containing protein
MSATDVERLENRIAELERENAALRTAADPGLQEALQHQSQITRTIADNATACLFMLDAEGRCTFLNPAAERVTGYGFAEVRGQSLHELLHHTRPDGTPYPASECPLARSLPESVPIREREEFFVRKDGSFFAALCTTSPIVKDGLPVGTVIEVRDVTEERRVEAERQRLFAALEVERSRLASVFMQAPAFIATVRGPEHVFELANPPYYRLVGHREILGKPVREALPEVAGQGFFELLDQVYATGQPFTGSEVPIRFQREEGGPLELSYVNFVYQPLFDAEGAVSGIFAHGVDLTEQVRTAEALRENDRRKDEFLALLGHELRNPLAPIRNAVHILEQAGQDEALLERTREMIDRQVAHMTRLVDDLLDISRISQGKILLRRERLDLVELVRHAVEDHRGELESGGLGLDLDLPPQPSEPLWVEGDRIRLSQMLGNLLHNAGKFTDPGGRVTVELAVDPPGERAEWAEVVVRDTGIGMDPEMLERLFETFSQADRSLARSRGGLGLGLALVHGLAGLHGGEVSAASEGLGRGSRFTLRLPLASAAAAPRAEAEVPAPATSLPRVLVVEDNADAAESMQLLLELRGFETVTAGDGVAGLELARRFRPDVVLCDIGLPGALDGYAVARELRADPAFAGLRLIALTGYGQAEDQRRAYAAGFDLHLTKPVDPATLLNLLASPAFAAGLA